ncbi:MAG: glycoside hydrolase family 3 protein, partial [Maricaulis sp.]
MVRPDRREILKWGAAGAMAAACPAALADIAAMPLAERVGRMLLLGFIGSSAETEGADVIADHLAHRRIGGVLFLR